MCLNRGDETRAVLSVQVGRVALPVGRSATAPVIAVHASALQAMLTRGRAWRQLLEHKDAQTRAKKSSARARQEDATAGQAPPQDEGAVSAFTCLQVVRMRCKL